MCWLAGVPAAILDHEIILKTKTHAKEGETESWKEPGTSEHYNIMEVTTNLDWLIRGHF